MARELQTFCGQCGRGLKASDPRVYSDEGCRCADCTILADHPDAAIAAAVPAVVQVVQPALFGPNW